MSIELLYADRQLFPAGKTEITTMVQLTCDVKMTSPKLKMTSTYNWRHLRAVSEAAEFWKIWDFLSKWERYVDPR